MQTEITYDESLYKIYANNNLFMILCSDEVNQMP